MQSAMQQDERSFAFQARQLIDNVIVRVDAVADAAAFTNDLANDIAFHRVAFTHRVMASRLRLMLQCAPVQSLSNVKRPTVGPQQNINIVSSCDRAENLIGIGTIAFKHHCHSPT